MLPLTDELPEAKDLAGAEVTRASVFPNLEGCVSTRDDRFRVKRGPFLTDETQHFSQTPQVLQLRLHEV